MIAFNLAINPFLLLFIIIDTFVSEAFIKQLINVKYRLLEIVLWIIGYIYMNNMTPLKLLGDIVLEMTKYIVLVVVILRAIHAVKLLIIQKNQEKKVIEEYEKLRLENEKKTLEIEKLKRTLYGQNNIAENSGGTSKN